MISTLARPRDELSASRWGRGRAQGRCRLRGTEVGDGTKLPHRGLSSPGSPLKISRPSVGPLRSPPGARPRRQRGGQQMARQRAEGCEESPGEGRPGAVKESLESQGPGKDKVRLSVALTAWWSDSEVRLLTDRLGLVGRAGFRHGAPLGSDGVLQQLWLSTSTTPLRNMHFEPCVRLSLVCANTQHRSDSEPQDDPNAAAAGFIQDCYNLCTVAA